ncbi:MAG: hypothetical protein Q9217_005700 [Psora testacea]
MSSSTGADESKPSEPVQLIDVDHLLNGCGTIQNRHAVLRDMVWSFFRAVLYALPPDIYPPYVRFLNSALAATQWLRSGEMHSCCLRLSGFIEYRLGILVAGKAGDKPSNYSATSTRVENKPLMKHTEDEGSVDNQEHHKSSP